MKFTITTTIAAIMMFLSLGSFGQSPCVVDGGTLTTQSPTSFCKSDGADDILVLGLDGAAGENGVYVVTWQNGQIFMISESNEFNLEGVPGNGICLFWHLSWNGEITGAEIGGNAANIQGCFDLSNPITVLERFSNGGTISTLDPTTFCDDDEVSVNVTVTNSGGANGQTVVWVVTDADLNILELGGTPPFSFDEAGTYLIWRLGYVGALNGASVGANAGDLSGDCFDLSNPITVTVEDCTPECVVDGGTISTESPTTVFCKSDGEPNVFTIDLEGAVGENGAYVVTFLDGEIILISESNTFDLEGVPGNGTCLFWHLSWTGELTGAVVGGNAADLAGECFDLSNSIEVEEQFANGGEISTEDETTFCAGDENSIDVTVTNAGGANGQTVVWVITDADLNILELGGTPPFSFDEAGTYLIWRLGYVGALNGASVGANAGDLSGDCFDLSNPITVTVEDCECVVDGGTISTMSPTTTFCKSDGEPNVFTIDLEGAVGENGAFVVTFLDGEIILISESNTFDLEGIPGNGTCLFWHLSWTGELTGAVVGGNAADLAGECFDLSNSIEVEEQFANGGEISTEDETTFCAGDENSIDVTVTNAGGANGQTVVWVITDADLNILELGGTPPFSFDEAGTYLIWRLGYVGALNGAEVGANAGNLSGDCFDLSNPITVTVEDCECVVDGGTISTMSPTTTFCKSDGEPNVFTIDLEGAVGENGAFVVTFLDGEIILISESNTFDLEGIPGNGTCLFWHLSWTGELTGAVVGGNAADLAGECFDLSNSIEVEEQFANGGEISTEDETTFCAGDENSIDVTVTNAGGANGQTVVWVITDADLNILELGGTPPFSFDEAGTYLIWRLGYVGALNGAEVGANAGNLSGDCFDLSNPITVTVEDCECVVDGGTISTMSPTTTFCKSDGEPNVFTIDLEGAVGENGAYVVTFLDGEIILISESNTFDLEGIPGNGTCLFWHLSWTGELTGAVVGGNAADLAGECFDLSNSIEVEEQFANGGTISTTVGQTAPVCINTLVPVSVSDAGGANGQNVAWVITSEDLTILSITTSGPFSFSTPGTYLIWRLGYVGTLNGASVGANAGDLSGDCFDLSNPLTIVVVQCLGDGLPSVAVNAELNSLPNPTNGYNMVIFNTEFNGRVVLDVYDMSGRNIQTLFNQDIQQGVEYRVEFDGTGLPNGVYIYRLTSDHGVTIHKFMIAR